MQLKNTLLCLAIVLISGSMAWGNYKNIFPGSDTCQPTNTSLSPNAARKMIAHFENHKYPILNYITQSLSSKKNDELKSFKPMKADQVTALLDKVIQPEYNGMRVYFGTRMSKASEVSKEDKNNAGRLILIFVPTKDSAGYTVDAKVGKSPYYKYNDSLKDFEQIDIQMARKLYNNYKKDSKKLDLLSSGMPNRDETRYIWYDICKLMSIRDYIAKSTGAKKAANVILRITSYTDDEYIDTAFNLIPIKQNYKNRLTIDFAFVNEKGDVVYESNKEFNIRLLTTIMTNTDVLSGISDGELFSFLSNANREWLLKLFKNDEARIAKFYAAVQQYYPQDTGIPIPPPRSNDEADLDLP